MGIAHSLSIGDKYLYQEPRGWDYPLQATIILPARVVRFELWS